MSSDFDPSPRALKRRRTTRYGGSRSILADDALDQKATHQQSASDLDGTRATGPSHEPQDADAPIHSTGKQTESRVSTGKRRASTKPIPVLACGSQDVEESDTPETPSRTARGSRTASGSKGGILASSGARTNGHDETVGDGNNGQNGEQESGNDVEDTVPQPRSSARQRRPPRHLADTLEDPVKSASTKRTSSTTVQRTQDEGAPASPALRGILTPSRKKRAGSRKSVMFDQDDKEIEQQLGFRDISTPAKPQAKSTTRKATPYPKRSKHIGGADEESHDAAQEQHYEPQSKDDALNEALFEEAPLELPLANTTEEAAPLGSTALLEDNPYLQEIKSAVLARLTSASLPLKAPGHLEKQYGQLHSLVQSTITASESNSLLLLGPRGAGKSTLLDLALKELGNAHLNDFHVVRLNGFLQTDDRLALREIWRQLGHSRNLDESETEDIGASYADTMASLLSLLSHPDEMMVDPQPEGDIESFAQHASIIASGGQKTSKSIVFVLDEFDLFTTHPRQTLLYNLFDIAQSRKAPIAVIGCSTRMDVIECLEKRVKSRFSHRWLLVPSVKNIAEWNQCVEDTLLVVASDEAHAKRSKEEEKWVEKWNSEMKSTFIPSKQIQSLVKKHFFTTKSLPDLFMALFPPIATLQIPCANTLPITKDTAPPTILSTIPGLPVLHLSLLIAMSRLETIHHLATGNFNLVHAHYTELIASTKLRQSAHGSIVASGSLRQWSRELCRGAWEEIAEWGLIVPVSSGRDEDSGGQEEETRMWRCDVGLEDVEWGVRQKFAMDGSEKMGGAGEVLLRWCKEV